MVYLLIFIVELGVLFFLSKKLINSLAKILYKFGFPHKVVVHILAIIFLPGTIVHELSHLLTAGMLLIPVGELNVLPEVEGESVKLGSVQIGESDPLRRTIVGVAPVILGILSLLLILYFLDFKVWWQIILGLYLVFEISNTMFSSKKDLEGVIGFILAILVVGGLVFGSLYLVSPLSIDNIWTYLNSTNMALLGGFFKQTITYLAVPIALDLAIIFLTRIIRK